jgi:hypothetical protein
MGRWDKSGLKFQSIYNARWSIHVGFIKLIWQSITLARPVVEKVITG